MVTGRGIVAAVAAVIVGVTGVQAASSVQRKAAAPLVPLRPNDDNPYVKELPGENLGDGGEFSSGGKRYVRLEGRHLTFRTASGVKACVIAPAAAKSWTFSTAGTVGCAGVSLTMAVNTRAKSDDGQPVIVTVTQGRSAVKMTGLWQGLD